MSCREIEEIYTKQLEDRIEELEEELRQFANHSLLHYWYEQCQKAERELRKLKKESPPPSAPF